MGACATTSCGKCAIKWKVTRDLNAKGVYTPEQISENADYYWKSYNSEDNMTVDKETCKKIVGKTVNYLRGWGGKSMTDEEFESKYGKFDMLGL